ncbi:MAG: hypothetical protein KGN01_07785 [Patescibacteria group bacterium]|nr:hypothetical protein [Patescibacteria group bacterium]
MSENIEVEWSNIEEKPEESEFKDEKSEKWEQRQKETAADAETQSKKTSETAGKTHTENDESIGLAEMISETWNEVGADRGYEPISDKQANFLTRHTQRLENKFMKERGDLSPEIEALLAHVVVYLPKWYKKKHADDISNDKKKK